MPRPAGRADRGLTPVQTAILDFILDHAYRCGYAPSLREMGAEVSLKSTSAVAYQARILEQKGYLSRKPGRSRSYAVTALYQPGRLRPSAAAATEPPGGTDDLACVPLAGRIAAGGPLLAFEDREEDLMLPRRLVGYGDLIALRIRGDSMTGAGINDGDIAVIRRQPRVEPGEKAAAMIRDEATGDFEATVKEYQVYNGHAWLVPHNPAYQIIPGDKAVVIGKVTAVVRGGL
jgi:repressor LexA